MGAPRSPHALVPGMWLRVDCVDRLGIAFVHDDAMVLVKAVMQYCQ